MNKKRKKNKYLMINNNKNIMIKYTNNSNVINNKKVT